MKEDKKNIHIDITQDLADIVEREIKKCNKSETIPSRELIDTVSLLLEINQKSILHYLNH